MGVLAMFLVLKNNVINGYTVIRPCVSLDLNEKH